MSTPNTIDTVESASVLAYYYLTTTSAPTLDGFVNYVYDNATGSLQSSSCFIRLSEPMPVGNGVFPQKIYPTATTKETFESYLFTARSNMTAATKYTIYLAIGSGSTWMPLTQSEITTATATLYNYDYAVSQSFLSNGFVTQSGAFTSSAYLPASYSYTISVASYTTASGTVALTDANKIVYVTMSLA